MHEGFLSRVNTMPGNIKSAIAGICRKLGPGSAERCLASFARRDNRRYQHQTVFPASSIATSA